MKDALIKTADCLTQYQNSRLEVTTDITNLKGASINKANKAHGD